ncbi:MAG: cob(I)yrinic acid a,c-diamide adenosyltransferase [Balneolaceae bacterium]|nr:cob(I)yrinic acid a,c-diamide adenosyltransferase [Balneolaceae bacterium]
MKIYTKKGDQGDTSLFGGDRVSKSTARIDAYGNVDELNSWIGLVLTTGVSEESTRLLNTIQDQLFILGADLATPATAKARIRRIDQEHIDYLESQIDRMEKNLPTLKNFVLPGGATAGAQLHVARTVCRRAERSIVRCGKDEQISAYVIKYINRLSDLLFVAARYENKLAGTKETTWKPDKES